MRIFIIQKRVKFFKIFRIFIPLRDNIFISNDFLKSKNILSFFILHLIILILSNWRNIRLILHHWVSWWFFLLPKFIWYFIFIQDQKLNILLFKLCNSKILFNTPKGIAKYVNFTFQILNIIRFFIRNVKFCLQLLTKNKVFLRENLY